MKAQKRNCLTKVKPILGLLPYHFLVLDRIVSCQRYAGWTCEAMNANALGHNSEGITVTIEARLFNSLSRYAPEGQRNQRLNLPAGSSLGDLMKLLSIPPREVFLALRNGRDVTASLYGGVNTEAVIGEGDVIALSGPVPYSWGYGSAVV